MKLPHSPHPVAVDSASPTVLAGSTSVEEAIIDVSVKVWFANAPSAVIDSAPAMSDVSLTESGGFVVAINVEFAKGTMVLVVTASESVSSVSVAIGIAPSAVVITQISRVDEGLVTEPLVKPGKTDGEQEVVNESVVVSSAAMLP